MGTIELFRPPQEMRELSLLQELERNPIISQRALSHKFGMALGVTNACLKKMVGRGWIKVREINRKKNGYFLTHVGLNQKAELTNHFLSYTVKHYKELKSFFEERFLEMEKEGIRRVVFYGIGDEMEIAYITIQESKIELIGIVEDEEDWRPLRVFGFHLEKLDQISEMAPDAIFITSTKGCVGRKAELLKKLGLPKRVPFFYI
jgi:hypothetical protein